MVECKELYYGCSWKSAGTTVTLARINLLLYMNGLMSSLDNNDWYKTNEIAGLNE